MGFVPSVAGSNFQAITVFFTDSSKPSPFSGTWMTSTDSTEPSAFNFARNTTSPTIILSLAASGYSGEPAPALSFGGVGFCALTEPVATKPARVRSTMGMRYVRADATEVVAELEIDDRHRQPYGIVHGGVHSGMIESVASVGAALVALPRGQAVVGLENHTSFLRAAREGRLRAIARPLSAGRTSQVWEGEVRDQDGRLLASGRVRVLCMDANATVAGRAPGAPETFKK